MFFQTFNFYIYLDIIFNHFLQPLVYKHLYDLHKLFYHITEHLYRLKIKKEACHEEHPFVTERYGTCITEMLIVYLIALTSTFFPEKAKPYRTISLTPRSSRSIWYFLSFV